MVKNFVITGTLFILIFIIIIQENIFGESKNTNEYQFLNKFGEKRSNNGELSNPHSIDIDKKGNVYVTDTGNDRIQKYSTDGIYFKMGKRRKWKWRIRQIT